MGYRCSFMDNETYTAQDVNDAFSHITSEGVAVFSDNDDALSDLNDAVSEIAEAGAAANSCAVIKRDGKYYISSGCCFMEDGSQITFDQDGFELEIPENEYRYVYLERNVAGNTIDVVVSENAGGDGTVSLAEIDTDGNIIDSRQFSASKIPLSTGNYMINMHIGLTVEEVTEGAEVNLGWSGFRYIIAPINESPWHMCVDVSDGEEHSFTNSNSEFSQKVFVRKSGQKLIFCQSYGHYDVDMDVEVI